MKDITPKSVKSISSEVLVNKLAEVESALLEIGNPNYLNTVSAQKKIINDELRTRWRTPRWLFDVLHKHFQFTVDAAANYENRLLDEYWSVDTDGLSLSWAGHSVFCNPPYARGEINRWVYWAMFSGDKWCLLLPARTDQLWFHDAYYGPHVHAIFLPTRIGFDPPCSYIKKSSPREANVLIWRDLTMPVNETKDFSFRVLEDIRKLRNSA